MLGHATDLNAGMHVTAEDIFSLFLLSQAGIMTKAKIIYAKLVMVNTDLAFLVPGFTKNIVVPFHQLNF